MKKIFKILTVIFLATISLVLILLSINIFRYQKWEKSFESNLENISIEKIPSEIEEKISKFVNSSEKNDFVEFSKTEIVTILGVVLNKSLEGIEIKNIHLETAQGKWKIFVKTKVGDFNVPWIAFDIIKDNMETAQVYVGSIYIGDYNITDYLPKNSINDINKGISDAIILFNENLFSKRYIQNIELGDTSIVIKGVLY